MLAWVGTRSNSKEADLDSSPMAANSSAAVLENEASVTSQCVIRPATPADIPHNTSIYARFVATTTATSEITVPGQSEILRRWQAVQDRDLPYLVAELEGYIVGFCYARPAPPARRLPLHGGRFHLRAPRLHRPRSRQTVTICPHRAMPGEGLSLHRGQHRRNEPSLHRAPHIAGLSTGRPVARSNLQIQRMAPPPDHAAFAVDQLGNLTCRSS